MRGLTLHQPMAWAIAEDHKPVENRPWALPAAMRGETFAVHAGKTYDARWADMIRTTFGLEVPEKTDIGLGCVVAVATFADCITEEDLEKLSDLDLTTKGMSHRLDQVCEWFSGPFGFLLRDIHKLPRPIPCRGFQGLWTVPSDIEQQIWGQLETRLDSSAPAPVRSTPEKQPPTPAPQLTLLDPVVLERERCLTVMGTHEQRWRSNNSAASNLVADALAHIAEEIRRG